METEDKVQRVVVRKKGMKSGRLYLRIGPNGVLRVTAALDVPDERIDSFVRSKRAWWEGRLATKTLSHGYRDGDAFRFMGRLLRLELVVDAEANRCVVKDNRLILYLKDANASNEQRQAIIGAAFVDELRKAILARLPFWMERMDIGAAPEVRFNNAWRMWACCRPQRRELRFSARVAALPPSLIDYLIVHELAHLRVQSHGPAFWAEVERILPDFKERENGLRDRYCDSFF